MAHGKKLICPPVVLMQEESLKFFSNRDSWERSGQILAQILAKTLKDNSVGLANRDFSNRSLEKPVEEAAH
jgi:hypothetical protein